VASSAVNRGEKREALEASQWLARRELSCAPVLDALGDAAQLEGRLGIAMIASVIEPPTRRRHVMMNERSIFMLWRACASAAPATSSPRRNRPPRPHAHRAQPRQRVSIELLDVAHDHGFRDLQFDMSGFAPISRTIESSVETSLRDMNWRGEMLIAIVTAAGRPPPIASTAGTRCGTPIADRHDEPQLLGEEDEVLGKISPFCG